MAQPSKIGPMPKGYINPNRYYLVIFTPACSRGWGSRGTPDIPWTLEKGYAWAQCFDYLQSLSTGDPKDYLIERVGIEDFMSSNALLFMGDKEL